MDSAQNSQDNSQKTLDNSLSNSNPQQASSQQQVASSQSEPVADNGTQIAKLEGLINNARLPEDLNQAARAMVARLKIVKDQPSAGGSSSTQQSDDNQAITLQSSDDSSASSPQTATTQTTDDDSPQIADDADLIEKEWVDKAKQIVSRTQGDPHAKSNELTGLKKDYIQKRYGKTIAIPADETAKA